MTSQPETATTAFAIKLEQRVFPPYDDFHATPSPMLWRRVTFETPRGTATFEQTDYGHPGRLNDWEPRGIASTLVSKLVQLNATLVALEQLAS